MPLYLRNGFAFPALSKNEFGGYASTKPSARGTRAVTLRSSEIFIASRPN